MVVKDEVIEVWREGAGMARIEPKELQHLRMAWRGSGRGWRERGRLSRGDSWRSASKCNRLSTREASGTERLEKTESFG